MNEESEIIFKARNALDFLKKTFNLSCETVLNIENEIKEYEANRFIYITKPFRTCDSMGKSLYSLMYSLKSRVKFEEK